MAQIFTLCLQLGHSSEVYAPLLVCEPKVSTALSQATACLQSRVEQCGSKLSALFF